MAAVPARRAARRFTGLLKTFAKSRVVLCAACGLAVAPGSDVDSRGFSLVETLVATTIIVSAVAGLAQLGMVAARSAQAAEAVTTATLLAHGKLEELRAEPLHMASPPGTLQGNIAGYCDFLDARGRRLAGAGGAPPAGTIYVRRWSVELVAAGPHDVVVLQAEVRGRGRAASARLATAKVQARR